MSPHDSNDGHRHAAWGSFRLALWTAAWAATLALAMFGPALVWGGSPLVSWIAVALNLGVGVGWIHAYARYLRAIDEVQRKINQDALTVTLGAGFVVGFAAAVVHATDLITAQVNLAIFPVFLTVVYLVAITVGWIRYR